MVRWVRVGVFEETGCKKMIMLPRQYRWDFTAKTPSVALLLYLGLRLALS